MTTELAKTSIELFGPLYPVELRILDEYLKHIPVQRRHGLLYDSIGHALCTDFNRTSEGPYEGHWFFMSKDAHDMDGRGAIIPFRFCGMHFEVHLPPPHAKQGAHAWMLSESNDETLHAEAAFAFTTAFVAKYWEYHSSAVLHPQLIATNS